MTSAFGGQRSIQLSYGRAKGTSLADRFRAGNCEMSVRGVVRGPFSVTAVQSAEEGNREPVRRAATGEALELSK